MACNAHSLLDRQAPSY